MKKDALTTKKDKITRHHSQEGTSLRQSHKRGGEKKVQCSTLFAFICYRGKEEEKKTILSVILQALNTEKRCMAKIEGGGVEEETKAAGTIELRCTMVSPTMPPTT